MLSVPMVKNRIKLLSKMGAGATVISGSINQIEHCARRSRSLCWRRAVSKD
ncbi:hypothetical protein T07_7559 [Trichinella nelsoni]|uniref:Uncharacterized protein n=1 Tax=Trichinella nelsoni TaxID=6336 RepID=A0A0V0RIU4_9BILA|nr:hypothetical protein T07_7559 [Trichinella nelsoni]